MLTIYINIIGWYRDNVCNEREYITLEVHIREKSG